MKGTGLAYLASLLLVLLAGGAQGNACRDKGFDCQFNITGGASRISNLFQRHPVDQEAVLTQCRALEDVLTSCKADILALCPEGFSRQNTLETMQNGFNSICGQNTMCTFKMQGCNLGPSTISEITGVIHQRPPNIQRAVDKCSQLNETVGTCLDELKADCAQLPGMPESISSISMALDSLCGQAALCRLQMVGCQSHFVDLGAAGQADSTMTEERVEKFCRAMTAAKQCMDTQIDAQCRSLPEIQPVLQGIEKSMQPGLCSGKIGQCPQVLECLSRRTSQPSEDTEQCSWPGGLMECIADLGGTCELKEDTITFKELKTLQLQFCKEIKKVDGGDKNCTVLGPCVLSSGFMQKVYGGKPSSSSPQIDYAALLDSQTWCQLLEVTSGCYVNSKDKCQLDPNLLSYMTEQHQRLTSVCHRSNGAKELMGSLILTLLLASLAAWTQVSL